MKEMMQIKDMACSRLEEIKKSGKLNLNDANDLNTVAKLTEIVKNIMKIEMLEEGAYKPGGYSGDGEWAAQGRYGHNMPMMGGHSYDDGSGRMNSGGRGGNNRRNNGMYSGNRGYSGDGDVKDELREMMKEASGRKREILRRAIEELEDD